MVAELGIKPSSARYERAVVSIYYTALDSHVPRCHIAARIKRPTVQCLEHVVENMRGRTLALFGMCLHHTNIAVDDLVEYFDVALVLHGQSRTLCGTSAARG